MRYITIVNWPYKPTKLIVTASDGHLYVYIHLCKHIFVCTYIIIYIYYNVELMTLDVYV